MSPSEVVERFVRECCITEESAATPTADLYAALVAWAGSNGLQEPGARSFAIRLSRLGYPSSKGTGGVRLRRGLRLEGEGVSNRHSDRHSTYGNLGPSPTPPKHLSEPAKTWWSWVANEYVLETGELPTLTAAAEMWDRSREARAAIDQHGMTYTDRFDQPKERPEVRIERNGLIAMARLIRELALDPATDDPRVPRVGGRS